MMCGCVHVFQVQEVVVIEVLEYLVGAQVVQGERRFCLINHFLALAQQSKAHLL